MIPEWREHITAAWLFLRQNNHTIPDEVLDYIRHSALTHGTLEEVTIQQAQEIADLKALYHSGDRCQCGDDEACAHVRRAEDAEARVAELENVTTGMITDLETFRDFENSPDCGQDWLVSRLSWHLDGIPKARKGK